MGLRRLLKLNPTILAKAAGPALALSLLLAIAPSSRAAPPDPLGREVAVAASSENLASEEYEFANCRFGVAARGAQLENIDLVAKLNAGWYLDFWANLVDGEEPVTYTPMVRIGQDRGGSRDCTKAWDYTIDPPLTYSGLGQRIDALPGAQWLVGNEPERVGQDGVCPREYARAYHDVYEYIKGRDPSAQVIAGGVIEPTAMRLAYLDIVLDAYEAAYGGPLPADGWAVHLYVLSETGDGDANIALGTSSELGVLYSGKCSNQNTWCHAEHDDISIVNGLIVRMRQWMRDRGYRNRPLLVTEFGILKPYHLGPGATCSKTTCSATGDGCFCDELGESFHAQRVADFVTGAFELMRTATDTNLGYPADDYRLIQQMLWFHLATRVPDALGHAANLANPDAIGPDGQWKLTVVGQAWRDYVRHIPPKVNLRVTDVPVVNGSVLSGMCSAEVTLAADIVNNGNTTPNGPVVATFYTNASLTDPLGTVTVEPPLGCVRETVVAEWTWKGLCAGTHQFWVKVNTDSGPSESADQVNVAEGLVVIDSLPITQVYLPAIWR